MRETKLTKKHAGIRLEDGILVWKDYRGLMVMDGDTIFTRPARRDVRVDVGGPRAGRVVCFGDVFPGDRVVAVETSFDDPFFTDVESVRSAIDLEGVDSVVVDTPMGLVVGRPWDQIFVLRDTDAV